MSLQVQRKLKHILPTLARLCLISTFFEDGLRMWVQWNEQREYMNMSWGCGYFLATVFVLVNLVFQLGGCVMVIIRYRVEIACGVLFFIVVLQVSPISSYYITFVVDQCHLLLAFTKHSYRYFCLFLDFGLQYSLGPAVFI